MAPIDFTVVTLRGNRYPVRVNDSEDVFTLIDAVATAVGIPRTQIEVVPRGTGRHLSKYKNQTIRNVADLRGDKDLLASYRPRSAQNSTLTGRTPNTRSLTDPNEKRYHSRLISEHLQQRAGKRKTRKSKKSRKTTRRRR